MQKWLLCVVVMKRPTHVLHASHVSTTGHETVVLRSPDTDVTVLGVAHSQDVEARIIFLTGTKQRRRYIDLTAIGRQLGHHVCQGLLALHSLTGCDSTSAFGGIGKSSAFTLLTTNADVQLCLGKIGCDFELLQNPEVSKAASKLVCQTVWAAL